MKIYKIAYVAAKAEWSKSVDINKLTEQQWRDHLAKYPEAGEQGLMCGFYHHLGWVYDLRDEFERFLVITPYGDKHIYYAKDENEFNRRFADYYQSDGDQFEPLDDYEIIKLPKKTVDTY